MSKSLTAKQSVFVDEYLIDLNATQAAIRAGYSKDTAKDMGYENLTKPHIHKAIHEAMDTRSERTQIDGLDIVAALERRAVEQVTRDARGRRDRRRLGSRRRPRRGGPRRRASSTFDIAVDAA